MKKNLIGMTMCLVGALLVAGIFDPTSPLMWVADSSLWFAIARGLMLVMLAALLFTNPPRALALRIAAMIFGAAMSVAAIALVLRYQINFLDAAVMLEVGIICMIEALEAELYEDVSVIDNVKAFLKRGVVTTRERLAAAVSSRRAVSNSSRIGSLTTK